MTLENSIEIKELEARHRELFDLSLAIKRINMSEPEILREIERRKTEISNRITEQYQKGFE